MQLSNHTEAQLSLFPTEDSIQAATKLIESKLPITETNELHSLLALYHNTLIQEIENGYTENRTTKI